MSYSNVKTFSFVIGIHPVVQPPVSHTTRSHRQNSHMASPATSSGPQELDCQRKQPSPSTLSTTDMLQPGPTSTSPSGVEQADASANDQPLSDDAQASEIILDSPEVSPRVAGDQNITIYVKKMYVQHGNANKMTNNMPGAEECDGGENDDPLGIVNDEEFDDCDTGNRTLEESVDTSLVDQVDEEEQVLIHHSELTETVPDTREHGLGCINDELFDNELPETDETYDNEQYDYDTTDPKTIDREEWPDHTQQGHDEEVKDVNQLQTMPAQTGNAEANPMMNIDQSLKSNCADNSQYTGACQLGLTASMEKNMDINAQKNTNMKTILADTKNIGSVHSDLQDEELPSQSQPRGNSLGTFKDTTARPASFNTADIPATISSLDSEDSHEYVRKDILLARDDLETDGGASVNGIGNDDHSQTENHKLLFLWIIGVAAVASILSLRIYLLQKK